MSGISRRTFVTGSMMLAVQSPFSPRAARAQEPLKVIVFPVINNLPIYAAQRQGFFAKRGLAVAIQNTPSSQAMRTGMARGEFDIAHAAVDNAVEMIDVGKTDIAIVMGGDSGFNELIVQNDIQSYEDLRGKTLIVDAPDTAFALLLYKMLEIKGLKRGDYTIKPVGGSLQRYEAMVKDKSNAATMLGLPSSVRAVKDGLKSLGSSADVTGPYLAAGVFTRRDWAKANSEKLTQYIAANIEGIRWAMLPGNKKEVLSIISEQLKLPEDIASSAYEIALDPHKGFARDVKLDLEGFRTTLRLRSEMLQTPGTDPNNPEKYLDLSYYNRALATL